MHKIEGAHLQYVNNHKAKFELKGMKTFRVTDYTNLAPLKCYGWTDRWEKCLGSTPIKNEKKTMKQSLKIVGAHLQCVNNHYAKFEYKGMNTVGVKDYTN